MLIRQLALCSLMVAIFVAPAFADDPIPVAKLTRTDAVDFDKEILPMLRQNCLACHNSTDAEGDIVLESVATILESESAVAGKPADSPIFTLAAHQDDPVMPPEDNEVKAKNLTSEQLGLLQLWIAQGAKPSANSTANQVKFAKLPPGIHPIYALAMSPNGQFLAAGRANQIFVYSIPGKRLVDRVTDPDLVKSPPYNQAGIAHLDLIQSLAFAPDNKKFVSGGFRTVKVWEKPEPVTTPWTVKIGEPVSAVSFNAARNLLTVGAASGKIHLIDTQEQKIIDQFSVTDKPVEWVQTTANGEHLVMITEKKILSVVDLKKKAIVGKPVTLAADAVSLATTTNNQWIAVGQADKSISVFELNAVAAAEKEPAKATRLLNGSGQPPKILKSYGTDSANLISGSDDGNIKLWNAETGANSRSFPHGGKLADVIVQNDGAQVVSCGEGGSVKVFDGTDSKLIKEIKGDPSVEFTMSEMERSVRLKQKLIDTAKQDLDAGTKEKTDEEANVKKTEETLTKATEEVKKKLDPKNNAVQAYTKANTDFEAKKKEVESLTAQKTKQTERIGAEEAKQKQLTADSTKLAAELAKQKAALDAAMKEKDVAQKAVAAKPDDADAKQALEKSTARTEQLVQSVAQAGVKSEELKKSIDAADKMVATAKADLAEVDKLLTAANAAVKSMDANVKKLADAQKKAVDEYDTAVRNETLAKNSVDRAKKRAKNSADRVPVLDKIHKDAVAAKAAEEKKTAEFKTSAGQRLNSVTGVISLDSQNVIYFGADGTAALLDSITGEKTGSFPNVTDGQHIALGDGKFLTLKPDGSGVLTQASSQWKLAKTIGNVDDAKTFPDRVTALDISRDGKLLATGSGEFSRSGEIKIWNLADGKLVKSIPDAHSDAILDIRFSPDGKKIASSSADRFMKTFDVESGKQIRVFEGHTHHVMSVDWNSVGRELSTAGADKVVKVWDAGTGTQKRTIAGYNKEVTSLCFIELTDEIVTASGDNTVRRKRTSNGGEVRSFGGFSDFVYSVAASADGIRLAAGGQDGIVRVWLDNGQLFVEFGMKTD